MPGPACEFGRLMGPVNDGGPLPGGDLELPIGACTPDSDENPGWIFDDVLGGTWETWPGGACCCGGLNGWECVIPDIPGIWDWCPITGALGWLWSDAAAGSLCWFDV